MSLRLFACLLLVHGTLALADDSLPAFDGPIGNPAETLKLIPVAGTYTCASVGTAEPLAKDVILRSSKFESHGVVTVTLADDSVNVEVESKQRADVSRFILSLDRDGRPSIKGIDLNEATPAQKQTIRSFAGLFYPLAHAMSGTPLSNFSRRTGQHYVSYQAFLKSLDAPVDKETPPPNREQVGPNDGEFFELPNSENYLYKVNSAYRFNCRPRKRYEATSCMDSGIGWLLIGKENGLPLSSDLAITHFYYEPTGMRVTAASRVAMSCTSR